jgi:hypothetical protein
MGEYILGYEEKLDYYLSYIIAIRLYVDKLYLYITKALYRAMPYIDI